MKKSQLLLRLQSRSKTICLSVAFMSSVLFVSSCENEEEIVKDDANLSAKTSASALQGNIGINVLVNKDVNTVLSELKTYGTVLEVIPEIKALTMRVPAENLALIQKLSYVVSANRDAQRNGTPVDGVAVSDFTNGLNTWNLDAVNVTELNTGRVIAQNGEGVYVGVMDTGLLDSWRQYFPQERIATEYAKAFSGGGGEVGNVSEPTNMWEHDQDSHGTHVTSTIIGYNLNGTAVNGIAPKAKIIPVKVLNQSGSGWSSVIARGIVYLADLKANVLKTTPLVINMSLGGPVLDAVEKAAIDYAVSKGVIIVASAGNNGTKGMGYPGAYAPVISVGSAGWKDAWSTSGWWYRTNFPDATSAKDLFISDFSSRQKTGQDLDVIAPGSAIVGPYQMNSGQLSYYYLYGTSMASPHVAGIVALMTQVKPGLTAGQTELILEDAALPIAAGSRSALQSDGSYITETWGSDATGHGFITANAALSALSKKGM